MIREFLMNIISPVFYQVLYMTIIGSIVGILVYFIRSIFDKKMSGKSKCILWGIVLVTLLIPIRFEVKSNYAVFENSFVDRVEDIKYVANYDYIANEKIATNNDISVEENNEEQLTKVEHIESNINNENVYKIPIEVKIKNIVIPTIWLLGTVILILTFISTTRSIRKRISKNIYKDERIENILNDCKNQLNIKRKVNIVLQKKKRVPSIFGIFNPSILITKELLEEDNQTIKYIFLHELSHYKRKDILLNYILLLVLSIHWFNPVVWFLFNKIRQDIEIGADELASRKLTKAEKKEYGMVLINSLRAKTEENYASNLLCMSDTEKNMERRIFMLKGKSKSIFLSMIIIAIITGLVVGFIFIKNENNEVIVDNNNESNILSNDKENNNAIDEVMELTNEERIAIENYINELCHTMFQRIPEIENINDADKEWIYAHLKLASDRFYATEEEIDSILKDFFGDELNISVKEDQKLISPQGFSWIPFYDETGEYFLPRTSSENVIHYAINKITKTNENYVVNVIEFSRNYDLLNDEECKETIICTYDASINNHFKWREVFRIETDKLQEAPNNFIPSPTLVDEVLKRKDEFLHYNITIKKEDEGFIVKKIEMMN